MMIFLLALVDAEPPQRDVAPTNVGCCRQSIGHPLLAHRAAALLLLTTTNYVIPYALVAIHNHPESLNFEISEPRIWNVYVTPCDPESRT